MPGRTEPNPNQVGMDQRKSMRYQYCGRIEACCSTFQALFIQLLYLKFFMLLFMMDWSDEQTIYFIEMYRERSFLWEPIDSLYKNRNKCMMDLWKSLFLLVLENAT